MLILPGFLIPGLLIFCTANISVLVTEINLEGEIKLRKQEKEENLKSIVGPAPELHDTGLLVEGEILDVHLAGAVVDGGGPPLHLARTVEGRLGGQRHLEVTVSAENTTV